MSHKREKTQASSSKSSSPPAIGNSSVSARHLRKVDLGGVIFGCKNYTISECFKKKLFGLPALHYSYVKNIEPGLPLFLFNYTDRKLHGIYEARSKGQMHIDRYAWTVDGSEATLYPAQVRIHVRKPCQPLVESQFKSVICENFYSDHHFWFELDHDQVDKLLKLFALAPGNDSSLRSSSCDRSSLPDVVPSGTWQSSSNEPVGKTKYGARPWADVVNPSSIKNSTIQDVAVRSRDNNALGLGSNTTPDLEQQTHLNFGSSSVTHLDREGQYADLLYGEEAVGKEQPVSVLASESGSLSSSNPQSDLAQLSHEMEESKHFEQEQLQVTELLEEKQVESDAASQELSALVVRELLSDSINKLHLDFYEELIYLVGGYNGKSWLSALDSYLPIVDKITSLRPMTTVHSYASATELNGDLYIFGGGTGDGIQCYNTVERYRVRDNEWTPFPHLISERERSAATNLHHKLFVIGGGGTKYKFYSAVEMFDPIVGSWIGIKQMFEERAALAAATLNGAIYAVGGFDGKAYLRSAERLDPREPSWAKLQSMNISRGSHSLVVLNEKLYALGGYDGSEFVSSVEVFDPRTGTWIVGDPMNSSKGYTAAAVLGDSLYVMGGMIDGRAPNNVIDTVECYKEGEGWNDPGLKGFGKRCACSAFVF